MHATRKKPETTETGGKTRKVRAAHVTQTGIETGASELREISADLHRIAKQMEAGGHGAIRVDGGALLSRGIDSLQRFVVKCQLGLQEAKSAARA